MLGVFALLAVFLLPSVQLVHSALPEYQLQRNALQGCTVWLEFRLGCLVLLVSRVQQVLLFKHHAQHQQIHITLAMALVLLQTLAPGCAGLVTTSTGVPALLVLPTPGALQGL